MTQGHKGSPETPSPQTMEKLVWLPEKVSLAPVCRQSWPLQHRNEQPAPSSASSTATLLLDGSRQLSLALPRFAAQAEMNIQELERHSHLWCEGCGQGVPEKPLVRPPVRAAQVLSCPPVCPRSLAGRQRRPSGSRARVSRARHGGRPELATQWDFSLIACLAEG